MVYSWQPNSYLSLLPPFLRFMRCVFLLRFLPVLLLTSLGACSSEEVNPEITPQQLVGQWDAQYYQETQYDAEGKVTGGGTRPAGNQGASQVFTADKKYTYNFTFRVQDAGTYSLQDKELTLTVTSGRYLGTQKARIVRLTETELVEEFDLRTGKEGLVSVLHATKH